MVASLALLLAIADPRVAAVLHTETRWLTGITNHDVRAVDSILAPNFVHINYRGERIPRAQALAAIERHSPYMQNASDETVTFAGSAAIVHGINTISQNGKVVARLRFTDVFEERDGRWQAVSAQETVMP